MGKLKIGKATIETRDEFIQYLKDKHAETNQQNSFEEWMVEMHGGTFMEHSENFIKSTKI